MVSNFAQQLPTTRNNMQQGVQTDATCNMQKFWELMASKVASDGMGFNFIRKRIFFLWCGRHTKSLCLLESKRSALKFSWWQDKRENKCVTFLTCSPFTTMLTNQNRDERKFCRHSRWKNVEVDPKKTFRFTPKLLLIIIYKFHNNGSGHFIFKLKSVYEHIKIIYVNCGVKNYLKEDHLKRICDDLPSNN